jgi:RNA polymerase sigma-70 factor (ECF subfamily)
MTPVSESDTLSFLHARPKLITVARRVLASAGEADDVVQEAWIRWQQRDRSTVRDPAAFLTTTTMRLALNANQSARSRHDAGFGPPPDIVDATTDLVSAAERREAIEQALARVLERLSRHERAVYVLREAFDYPHTRTAAILGLSEANVRQIAARARRAIVGHPRRRVDVAVHARLVEAFTAAAQTGELGPLERLLCDEATDARLAA